MVAQPPPDGATRPAGGQELYAQKIQILGIRCAGRGPMWSWPGRMARRTPRKPLHASRALGFLRPSAGVHHSMTSRVAAGSRWVCTTRAMSARKRSPSWPSASGPAIGLAGDLGLARPLRLGPLDRVDRGAVQRKPRIAAQVRALAGVGHRAEDQFAVLDDRLDPGDPRRPVGPYGGNRLVPVRVEQRPHALGELRLCLLEIPPRRHEAHDRTGPPGSRPGHAGADGAGAAPVTTRGSPGPPGRARRRDGAPTPRSGGPAGTRAPASGGAAASRDPRPARSGRPATRPSGPR